MKVLIKAEMPDGTRIQIEDWREDYPTVFNTFGIAAYPKAKYGSWNGIIKRGEKFRLDMNRDWKTNEEVINIFGELQRGIITLEELGDHYWDGNKAKFYMGFESVPEEPRNYSYV